MSITISQIVASAFLRTKFLAGERGGARSVSWAHTCELPDPWNWLGEGELLLVDGYSFPPDAGGQAEFIRRLADARLAGLALAAGMHAPPLTQEAARIADSLQFPILETEYELPFVAMARAVADLNGRSRVASLSKILNVYDQVQRLDRSIPGGHGLLEQLGHEAGAQLHVLSNAGAIVLESTTQLPYAVVSAVVDSLKTRSRPLPGFMPLVVAEKRFLIVPLENPETVLVVQPLASNAIVELALVQHIATIVSLEINRRAQEAEAARVASGVLFSRILDGALTEEGVEARLELAGFPPGAGRRVIAAPNSSRTVELQERLFHERVNHLLLTHGGLDLWFTDSPHVVLDRLNLGDTGITAGISLKITSAGRIPDAVREARWAQESAAQLKIAVVTYGEVLAPFLPRTIEEARVVVESILGPIIAHDQMEGADLLATLEAFLDSDRSWQIAARKLGVHKQTVVYRIRQIEALTGRVLRNVGDQTDLYLALKAQNLIGV